MERKFTTDRRVVTFNPNVQVLKMCVWNYAFWAARNGNWIQIALDRYRFQRRIQEFERKFSYILTEKHREKFFSQTQHVNN